MLLNKVFCYCGLIDNLHRFGSLPFEQAPVDSEVSRTSTDHIDTLVGCLHRSRSTYKGKFMALLHKIARKDGPRNRE